MKRPVQPVVSCQPPHPVARVRRSARRLTAILLLLPAGLLWAPAVQAETLAVTVVDGQSGEPVAGAFVLVGMASGDPFAGNYGWTDATGSLLFDDPALAGPQTVTAASDGYGHTTLYQAALGELTLPLFPPTLDPTMGGTITHIEGTVAGIGTTNNDGYLDVALILPAVSPSELILGDQATFSFGSELVTFPVVGEVEMPENSFMPNQTEYYIFTFSKSPWRLDVAGGRPTTFASVSGRISIDDLTGGAGIEDFEIRELGVERDVQVHGPMNVTIASDLSLSGSITAQFAGVPGGSDLLASSGGLIFSGDQERIVGYSIREGNASVTTTFPLSGMNPGGDMSDAVNVVVGAYTDSSAVREYAAAIMERDGFSVPHTAVLDSWLLIPDLAQEGRQLFWSDPTQPGLSPAPTWTRSLLGLRPIDPLDPSIPVTAQWRVYAAASPGSLTLPTLPPAAPGPAGGLPDPAATPEADQLYWELSTANASGDPGTVVAAFLTGATHWSMRWIPLDLPVAAIPDPHCDPRSGQPFACEPQLRLHVQPVPSAGPVTMRWELAGTGDPLARAGWLEIFDVDGRMVVRKAVDLQAGMYRWNGRDGDRELPAGLYWARLFEDGGRPAIRSWLRIR
jgi:hypothetical protein